MKKTVLTIFFALLSFGIVQAQFDIPPTPEKQTSFYDYIGLLNNSGTRFLEEKLLEYSDSTSTQIVIIIIDSTEGENILKLATRWGNEWGIGQAGKDNGIVLLMAKDDREVAIATGEGIRNKLTDSNAQRIINVRIIPQFKKGQYYRGLDDGIEGVVEVLNGRFNPKKSEETVEGIISDAGNTLEDKIFRHLPIILFTLLGLIVLFVAKKFIPVDDDDRWDRMDRHDRFDDDNDYDSGSSFGGGSSDGDFGGGSFGGGGASGSW